MAVLALLPLGACNCDPELNIVPGSIEGRVCDAESGIGIGGAGITLSGGSVKDRETLSDGQGTYQIDRVLPGDYTITASKGDLVRTFPVRVDTQKRTVVTDSACRGIPGDPDGGTLVGQVCNRHTGQLISAAEVAILLPSDELMLTTTDADGNFEIEGVPAGDHVVRISGDGYQRSFQVHITKKRTTTLDLADGCSPVSATEGGVVGSFCDPATEGNLVGANVTVRASNGSGEEATDITDTDGTFLVGGLTPGLYDVDVSHPAHSFAVFGIAVEAGDFTTVLDSVNCEQRPEFGRLEGQICDQEAGGRFVGNVELSQDAVVVETTQSNSEGRFAFNGLVPGVYDVRAFSGGYERVYPGVVVEAFQTTVIQEEDCPGPEDICEEFQSAPTVSADGRILLIVDRSGSMEQSLPGSGTSKWNATKSALQSVTSSLNASVEFGLMFFPDATGDNFDSGACNEGGTVELQVGPNHAGSVASMLNGASPLGGTPTAQALAAARAPLQSLASDGRPLAVLLATDGGPNCNPSLNGNTCRCTGLNQDGSCSNFNCLDDVNAIAEVGRIHDLGVAVYVLGLPGTENFGDVLNNMAQVGGTALPSSPRYYEANDQTALQQALDAITNRVLSCRVETTTDLATVDSITVSVDGQVLARDPARQNGWDIVNASTVELFGSACDLASASAESVVVRTCNEP